MKIKFPPETVRIFFVDFFIAFEEVQRKLAPLRADAENPSNDGNVDQEPFFSDPLEGKMRCPLCNQWLKKMLVGGEESQDTQEVTLNYVSLICKRNHATTFKWEPQKGWIWVSTEADVTVEKAQINCGPS